VLILFIGYTVYLMTRRNNTSNNSTLNEFLAFLYTIIYGIIFAFYAAAAVCTPLTRILSLSRSLPLLSRNKPQSISTIN
jgi:hypothetical protein